MAKIQTGEVVDLLVFSKASAPIGEIKSSMLTLAQFEEENLGQWVLCNGASCVGTTYHTITGNTNVPDAVTEGTVLRQAKAGRALGSFENDAMQGHRHGYKAHSTINLAGGSTDDVVTSIGTDFGNSGALIREPISDGVNGAPRTANETRMKNTAVNFYIKVGY